MSGVERYYVGVQGGLPRLVEMTPEYEAETGFKGLVHGSYYDTLAAELATVKKVAYGNIELMEERDTLRTANQRLEGEVARLREALSELMRLDVAGHQLQDRLQFSNSGRDILHKCQAALRGNGGDV